MFRKNYSTDQKRARDRAVNTKEHLSKMSPSEIVDEMENIFLGDNSDDMDVDQLLAYLDHLDQVAPIDEPFDAEESYQQFAQEHAALLEAAQTTAPVKSVRHAPRIIRRLIPVASIIILIVGIASITYASSTPFAQWVNETFSFNSRPTGEYTSLQEALDDYSIKEKLLPNWLPKEYVISTVSVNETTAFTTFLAYYDSVEVSDHSLTITIREGPAEMVKTMHEKDITSVDPITSDTSTYYIGYDNGQTSIIWELGRYQCNITGIIAEDDVSKIIDSIN